MVKLSNESVDYRMSLLLNVVKLSNESVAERLLRIDGVHRPRLYRQDVVSPKCLLSRRYQLMLCFCSVVKTGNFQQGIFYCTGSISDCIASKGRVISKWRTGKDRKESARDLIKGLSLLRRD